MPEQLRADPDDVSIWNLGRAGFNFYAIAQSGKLTLIDAGLKGDWGVLTEWLAVEGYALADIEAVLLTHAHFDHRGLARRLQDAAGTVVRSHPDDVVYATQPGEPPGSGPPGIVGLLKPLAWVSMLGVGFHIVSTRSFSSPKVREVTPFSDGDDLDLPGRPRVIHVPGHTPGSVAFQLPAAGVLFSGDALITRNVITGQSGPQVAPRLFNSNHPQAIESLRRLEGVGADLILPGHGTP